MWYSIAVGNSASSEDLMHKQGVSPSNNLRIHGRTKVKFTHTQRMEYVFWHKHLLLTLNNGHASKEGKGIMCRLNNDDCTMPETAVKEELRYLFAEDYRCRLTFYTKRRSVRLGVNES